MGGRDTRNGKSTAKPVGLGRLDEKDPVEDQAVVQAPSDVGSDRDHTTPVPAPALGTVEPPMSPAAPSPLPTPVVVPPMQHQPPTPHTVKSDLHLLLPGLVGRRTRVPRGFRLDTDLIEYLELHEMYRTALPDQRTFVEKLNDWIRMRMVEDTPVLIRAADALKTVRDEEEAQASLTDGGNTTSEMTREVPALSETVAPKQEDPSAPPSKKGPSIWDLEKQIKSGRGKSGSTTL